MRFSTWGRAFASPLRRVDAPGIDCANIAASFLLNSSRTACLQQTFRPSRDVTRLGGSLVLYDVVPDGSGTATAPPSDERAQSPLDGPCLSAKAALDCAGRLRFDGGLGSSVKRSSSI